MLYNVKYFLCMGLDNGCVEKVSIYLYKLIIFYNFILYFIKCCFNNASNYSLFAFNLRFERLFEIKKVLSCHRTITIIKIIFIEYYLLSNV